MSDRQKGGSKQKKLNEESRMKGHKQGDRAQEREHYEGGEEDNWKNDRRKGTQDPF